jgi:hypothetical protein
LEVVGRAQTSFRFKGNYITILSSWFFLLNLYNFTTTLLF